MTNSAQPPKREDTSGNADSGASVSKWTALAREVAQNPDSPRSLQIQSAITAALAPRERAAQQVVAALIDQSTSKDASAETALQAAVQHWERIFEHPMTLEELDTLRKDAQKQIQAGANQPPSMQSILGALPGRTDTLYELGVSVHGLQGTWHRLWGITAMVHSFGQDPSTDDGVVTVRAQFEQALGRALTADEWQALRTHAVQHANRTMK